MEEENKTAGPAESVELLGGKFKSVDALLHAYGELEAEFTRRSQRLKALEGQLAAQGETQAVQSPPDPAPAAEPAAAHEDLGQMRGVPLLGAGGSGVVAAPVRPASIAEAGALALGYFKRQRP